MRISIAPMLKMRRLLAWALLLSVPFVACSSDSPSDPDGLYLPDSPGSGTVTLRVIATAEVREVGASVYETYFEVTVTDSAAAPVPGAVVTFVAGFGTLRLTETQAGVYTATRAEFIPGSYTLDVSSGPDYLVGLTASAPEIHTITKPAANDTVTANTAFNVRWAREILSDQCRLESRDYDSDWIFGDTSTLWVPSVGNPPRTDQRVRVSRRNVQLTAAGLPVSQLSVSVRRNVEPIIAQ